MKTIKEYNQLYNHHKSFTLKISDLVQSLLKENILIFHLIENRTKTQLSYAEKIVRKNRNPQEDKEITDISGVRIITYYQKDANKIADIIKKEFLIDFKNSIDKGQILKENEFGYQSIHYVANISAERAKLTEWKSYKNLNVEIQIRTVLQHAWASISHELQYKKTYEIPNALKRKLFRLAGLFELADEQFGELQIDHLNIEKEILLDNKSNKREVSNEINFITMQEFIKNSSVVSEIEKSALAGGFSSENFEDEDEDEKNNSKMISEILKTLQELQITTVDEVEVILKNSLSFSTKYFTKLIRKADYSVWKGSKDFYVLLILMTKLNHFDEDYFTSNGWGSSTLKIVRDIASEY